MEAARQALDGLTACAQGLRLVNCVGSERALALQRQAEQVDLEETLEAMAQLCQLALDCIGLTRSLDLELCSQMMDCFDHSSLIVWGFSTENAQLIALSLAAIAGLLEQGNHDLNVPSHRYAKQHMLAPYLEPVAEDFDVIAPQVYAALCRFELQEDSSLEERRLVNAFQSICVWILTILYRLQGSGLDSSNYWDWASKDAHWALVLAKGVLAFEQQSYEESVELPVPRELLELKTAVLLAALRLHSVDIAFQEEFEADVIADDLDGGISLAERLVGTDAHRARLAHAAVDCSFLTAALTHASCDERCVHALLPFLSALFSPLQSSATAWREELTQREAQGVLDAFAAEAELHRHSLWAMLCLAPGRPRLWDLAALAAAVPPPTALLRLALDRWTTEASDASELAALVQLAANGGLAPGEAMELCRRAAHEAVTEQLARARTAMRRPELWEQWYNALNASMPPCEPRNAAQELKKGGLREVINGAPRDLCCALDGKLLMDPVRSPYGHVFERSSLQRALREGVCPLTSQPLTLAQCGRDGELRLRARGAR